MVVDTIEKGWWESFVPHVREEGYLEVFVF